MYIRGFMDDFLMLAKVMDDLLGMVLGSSCRRPPTAVSPGLPSGGRAPFDLLRLQISTY